MSYSQIPHAPDTGLPCQFINPDGGLANHLPPWADDTNRLIKFYETMVLIRLFDKKSVALQRTGQIGTYPPCLGHEAFSTAIGYAMADDDVFVPYYRDQATQYLRGVSLHQILLYWGGDERGSDFQGSADQDLPNAVPVATQITHAAGVASALKIKGETRAAVTTCGDGATSRGDFYESLNLAGVWQLPLVVVVNNNQWAISVPRERQTRAQTIACKSVAAGIEGFQVDGNDVVAVYDAVDYALDKAKGGNGATLIEAITYRLGDHTTADDATRYRDINQVNRAWRADPISRLRKYLHDQEVWDEAKERALVERCNTTIEDEVVQYLNTPPQEIADLFDYLYADQPAFMEEQKAIAQLKAERLA